MQEEMHSHILCNRRLAPVGIAEAFPTRLSQSQVWLPRCPGCFPPRDADGFLPLESAACLVRRGLLRGERVVRLLSSTSSVMPSRAGILCETLVIGTVSSSPACRVRASGCRFKLPHSTLACFPPVRTPLGVRFLFMFACGWGGSSSLSVTSGVRVGPVR